MTPEEWMFVDPSVFNHVGPEIWGQDCNYLCLCHGSLWLQDSTQSGIVAPSPISYYCPSWWLTNRFWPCGLESVVRLPVTKSKSEWIKFNPRLAAQSRLASTLHSPRQSPNMRWDAENCPHACRPPGRPGTPYRAAFQVCMIDLYIEMITTTIIISEHESHYQS